MICEECGAIDNSRVLDSRSRGGYISRQRECLQCGHRYRTWEILKSELQPKPEPKVLPLESVEEEALWLELCTGELIPTAVKHSSGSLIQFYDGHVMMRTKYRQLWRVWNRKPTDSMRRKKKWKTERFAGDARKLAQADARGAKT